MKEIFLGVLIIIVIFLACFVAGGIGCEMSGENMGMVTEYRFPDGCMIKIDNAEFTGWPQFGQSA